MSHGQLRGRGRRSGCDRFRSTDWERRRPSERRSRLLQKLDLLFRRGAAENAVAVRKTAEPLDDAEMLLGIVHELGIADAGTVDFYRQALIGQIFAVLQRQVKEHPLIPV